MVSDDLLKRLLPRLMVNYRPSFSEEVSGAATLAEWKRNLSRMEWCDDETFEQALDWIIDNERTNGFLPEWSLIRGRCWSITKERRARQQADDAIEEVRRRSRLTVVSGGGYPKQLPVMRSGDTVVFNDIEWKMGTE